MAKKETAIIQISPELKKNLDIISAFKVQVDEVSLNCQQIVITDDLSLSVAQQSLSKANSLLKMVKSKIKFIRTPYNDSLSEISKIGNPLSESLESAVKHLKSGVEAWEQNRLAEQKAKQDEIGRQLAEKVALEQAESSRKDAIRSYIDTKATPALKKCYERCTSVDECDTQLKYIESQFKPKEFFQEFAEEAYSLKNNYVDLIKAKRDQLSNSATMSAGELELAKKQQELALQQAQMESDKRALRAEKERLEAEKQAKLDAEAAEVEKQRLADESAMNKTKGIRYTWAHELINIDEVPKMFLTINEDVVKEFIKNNKDNLKDGETKFGIKFFKKMGVSS